MKNNSNIEIINVIQYTKNELIHKLQKISMLKKPAIFPYKKASISIERLNLNMLTPSQDYILITNLLKMENLKFELQKHNIDIFNLNGYISLTIINDNKSITVDLLPIIVEECILDNGKIAYIIADGMHRSYMSYLQSVNPEIVFIRGIPKEYSYYAYPFKINDWNMIKRFEHKLPSDGSHIKKWRKHTKKDNYNYYRNYNSVFNNTSKPKGGY